MGYALAAAGRGFHVFPVAPGSKTPGRLYPNRPEAEAPWTVKWSEVATTDLGQIIAWWNACPLYNIGIACKPSNLLVVDCDVKPHPSGVGNEYNGLNEWITLYDHYDPKGLMTAEETYQVSTGGGGVHFYYRWPRNVQATQSGIAAHVDIRSNGGNRGGYVLGQGSITTKGTYTDGTGGYASVVMNTPNWLIELCREKPKVEQPAQTTRIGQPAALSFAGLATAVATSVKGKRNHVLYWAAIAMRDDGACVEEALEYLLPYAQNNGLTFKEASDTIRSGYKA